MINKNTRPAYYLRNCFLLLLPVMAWNIVYADALPGPFMPDVFWVDIPPLLALAEQVSRAAVFGIALLMPLSIRLKIQWSGLALYIAGLLIYFASWLVLMYRPDSAWSHSYAGFTAPAYTPAIWLAGIALMGGKYYFGLPPGRKLFISIAVIFLLSHITHTSIIYFRLY